MDSRLNSCPSVLMRTVERVSQQMQQSSISLQARQLLDAWTIGDIPGLRVQLNDGDRERRPSLTEDEQERLELLDSIRRSMQNATSAGLEKIEGARLQVSLQLLRHLVTQP